MFRFKKLLCLTLILFFAAVPVVSARSERRDTGAAQSGGEEGALVGRIAQVEGQLLRFVPEEKDWVATVKDAPFGLDDALYSGDDGKAEFIMPNNSWARIGASTQIQMITLKSDVTEMDVASGVARFYNRSSDGVVKATTPFGYVMAPAGSTFDLYVGDESVEVIAIKGSVDYIHSGDETKYEVNSGSTSIVADSRQVTSGEGNVDADWDSWNVDRDQVWTKRLQVKGDSVKYLPSQLHDDAHALEENGRWERVYYEGGYHEYWRPVTVSAGWAPFTVGRWTEWYGDHTWVPEESFGYVTHHYGNWVYVNSFWYWSPPVVTVRIGAPVVGIGFGWYPGRVAWISSGVEVGWVPLAPTEVYYCHYHWGPRAVVVGSVASVNINIGGFAYVNHAVVVNQNNFYNVNNYNNVRITNINKTTIINNYRGAPVVNNTVINNYNTNRQRYNFTNVNVTNKPHQSVVNRIEKNESLAKQVGRVNAKEIQRNVSTAKLGQVVQAGAVKQPKMTDKLVPAAQVNKPKSEVQFKQKDIKQVTRPPQAGVGPHGSEAQGKPGVMPTKPGEVGKPGRPGMPGQPGEGAQGIRPPRPGEKVQSGEGGKPGRPGLPGQTGEGAQKVRPPRPGEKVQPGESVRPGRPGQPSEGTQGVKPPRSGERVQPGESVRPGRPGQPSEGTQGVRPPRSGERVQPGEGVRPGRPGQPSEGTQGVRPPRSGERVQPGEGVRPGRPGQPAQPADRPLRGRSGAPGERMQPGEQRSPVQPPGGAQRTRPSERVQPGVQPGQPGGMRTRPPQERMPQGEMGQPQRQRQQREQPRMERPPVQQHAPQRQPGKQQVEPGEKKKQQNELQ